jgi:hypothetical protein
MKRHKWKQSDATPVLDPKTITIEYNRGLREYRVVTPPAYRGGDYYTPLLTLAENWARIEYGPAVTLKFRRV